MPYGLVEASQLGPLDPAWTVTVDGRAMTHVYRAHDTDGWAEIASLHWSTGVVQPGDSPWGVELIRVTGAVTITTKPCACSDYCAMGECGCHGGLRSKPQPAAPSLEVPVLKADELTANRTIYPQEVLKGIALDLPGFAPRATEAVQQAVQALLFPYLGHPNTEALRAELAAQVKEFLDDLMFPARQAFLYNLYTTRVSPEQAEADRQEVRERRDRLARFGQCWAVEGEA